MNATRRLENGKKSHGSSAIETFHSNIFMNSSDVSAQVGDDIESSVAHGAGIRPFLTPHPQGSRPL